jgi:4-amino-4-deoxy-L-arabinose transferase-like glycosyltransferase
VNDARVGLTGGAIAFVLAVCGTEALKRPAARPWGLGLIVLGAALGAVFLDGLRPLAASVPLRLRDSRAPRALVGLAAAAALLAWADLRLLHAAAPAFGATEAIWALSIALFVASARTLSPRTEAREEPRVGAREVALLVAILAIGLAARTLALRDVPFAIHGDEILTGHYAREHFLPWRGTTLFTTVWPSIDLPALWFALVGGSLWVLGPTLEALRLPAALFGTATLVPFWALTRGLYGRATALLATALLACGTAHIHFSRVTLNNVTTAFFWTLCFTLLLAGLRRGRPIAWALAGLTGGLGEHFYYGTRLLPALLAFFFCHLWWKEGRGMSRRLPAVALVAFGYLVGFGPLLVHFATSPGLYLGRGIGVLAWNPAMNPGGALEVARTLGGRLFTNVLAVGALPSDDSLYFAPLLSVAEAALFWVGLAMLLRKWRDPGAALLVACALATVLVGGTLIPPAPAMNHWSPAFAAFYAILAAPLAGWLAHADRLGAAGRLAAKGVAAVAVVAIAAVSLDFYFRRYYALRPEFEIRAAQARLQAALGPRYRVFTVGETWQPYDAELGSYLPTFHVGAQIRDPGRQLPLARTHGSGLAFFFFDDSIAWLPRVEEIYPCGSRRRVTSRGGAFFFVVYTVTPLQAQRCASVRLFQALGGGWPISP